jgi:hypothetical protein
MRSRRWRNLLCCPQLTLGNSTSEPKKPVAGAQRQTTFSGATADADVYSQRAGKCLLPAATECANISRALTNTRRNHTQYANAQSTST